MRARYRWMLGTALFGLGLFALTAWRMPEIAAWRWRLVAGQPAMNTSGIALTAPLRWFDDYFAVAELSEDAYAIGEPRYGQCNFSYLIVGSKRALLFDTGPRSPGHLPGRPLAAGSWSGTGWYPRHLPVNGQMTLLAKYSWMR
jgi:hypothetical protein